MTCEDIRKKLVESLLGLLSPEDREELDDHAKSCPACAGRLEKIQIVRSEIAGKQSAPLPDWEASWRVIGARTFQKARRFAFFPLRSRWALAAFVAVIFILGATAGRLLLLRPRLTSPQDIFASVNSELAWRSYADRLVLFLVDFGNRAEVERPRNVVQQEKALIARILAETRALKSLLMGEGDEARVSLLDDAELILKKIENLKPRDKESAKNMAKTVRESPLKSKLRSILSSGSIS